MEETQEQTNSRPWLYKKGQSGNPGGRPVGSKSMKTWIKEKLATMTEEEREVFLEGVPKHEIWKMAEGNPANATDITSGGKPIVLPSEIIKQNESDTQPEDNSERQTQI
jgi:hypothetical protein